MTIKKKLAIGTLTLASGVIVMGTAFTTAFAATSTTYPDIVTKIASTFNLKTEDVAKVFAEERETRKDEHLDQLVADGKLTQDQRDKLEAKQDEIHAKVETVRNGTQTDAEKRKAIRDLHNELSDWMDDNGIEMPGRGGMGGFGGGPGMRF
jgi:chromosome condensin MukBEF ATPase and DNA-binding subunit MukB